MSPAGAAPAAAALEAEVRAILESRPQNPLDASVVPATAARDLVARHGLASVEALALLALPVARELARPPISGFRVAAVGIEEDGALVLGANLEFPGTDLGTTVHAEGFVPLRSRRRDRALTTLALSAARPCAHCRQLLVESAGSESLALIDLEGNRRSLDELYPHAFRPGALGLYGDRPVTVAWPALAIATDGRDGGSAPAEIADALLEAAQRAHAPYSASPSAVALRLRDGRVLSAGCLESVAFNPTITAAQAALVELAAARADGKEVAEAWLARTPAAPVDPVPGFNALIGATAPHARRYVLALRGAAERA